MRQRDSSKQPQDERKSRKSEQQAEEISHKSEEQPVEHIVIDADAADVAANIAIANADADADRKVYSIQYGAFVRAKEIHRLLSKTTRKQSKMRNGLCQYSKTSSYY